MEGHRPPHSVEAKSLGCLLLSWMFDVSSKGIHRTHSEISGSARMKLYILQALGLILSLTLAGLVGWWILCS